MIELRCAARHQLLFDARLQQGGRLQPDVELPTFRGDVAKLLYLTQRRVHVWSADVPSCVREHERHSTVHEQSSGVAGEHRARSYECGRGGNRERRYGHRVSNLADYAL